MAYLDCSGLFHRQSVLKPDAQLECRPFDFGRRKYDLDGSKATTLTLKKSANGEQFASWQILVDDSRNSA
jgi:hypothetical protein